MQLPWRRTSACVGKSSCGGGPEAAVGPCAGPKLTPKARPSTLSAATRAGSGAVAISAALSAGEPYLSASARYTDDMTYDWVVPALSSVSSSGAAILSRAISPAPRSALSRSLAFR